MRPETNPVDIAIYALGDLETLAAFLGASTSMIENWRKNHEFPNAWLKSVQKVTQLPIHLLLSKEQAQIISLVQMENDENGKV